MEKQITTVYVPTLDGVVLNPVVQDGDYRTLATKQEAYLYTPEEHAAAQQALSKAEDTPHSGWISVEDRLPICYQTGDWDGKRSELVLCENSKGYHIAVLYEGVMDGCKFSDWFDKDDCSIETPFKWKPI